MAHPRVLAWQETWMQKASKSTHLQVPVNQLDEDVEMDCEEAIERSRSAWGLSQWDRALPR
jgi:hypothetical protein